MAQAIRILAEPALLNVFSLDQFAIAPVFRLALDR
jgi:hypothetical protein